MEIQDEQLFNSIKEIIQNARERVFRAANSALLLTYWQIGQIIVEDEQSGKSRAEYGKYVLKNLSKRLTLEFGKGFDYTNLSNMRKFYLAFPIVDTLSQQLSWSHYRLLSSQENSEKRDYYLQESIENNWTVRDLKRQINSLAYERVFQHSPTEKYTIQNLRKDPYIFEFLGLPTEIKNTEKEIETAIIDHIQKFLLEFGKGFAFVARQQHI